MQPYIVVQDLMNFKYEMAETTRHILQQTNTASIANGQRMLESPYFRLLILVLPLRDSMVLAF